MTSSATTVYFGIDYGKQRIGMAISESGLVARPLVAIVNKGWDNAVLRIQEVVSKYCGSMSGTTPCIVVGLPLYKDGNDTEMSQEVRGFVTRLENKVAASIVLRNEYRSSVDAETYIRNVMGIRDLKKVKELVDCVAAFMVLQEYLDKLKGEKNEF